MAMRRPGPRGTDLKGMHPSGRGDVTPRQLNVRILAAAKLGIHRNTLRRKLDESGLKNVFANESADIYRKL